ncbi:hypothetical protein D6789_02300, partial [Candidatus Woesearchaeota archaeon]
MFGFLKKKLKDAVSVFSRKAEIKEEAASEEELAEALREEQEAAEPVEVIEPLPEEQEPPTQSKSRAEQESSPAHTPPSGKEASTPRPAHSEREKSARPSRPAPSPTQQKKEQKKEHQKKEKKEGQTKEGQKKEELPRAPPAKPTPQSPQSGFFSRIKETFTKKTLSPEKFDELFWDLELALLESNVAVEVIEKIKADLKNE